LSFKADPGRSAGASPIGRGSGGGGVVTTIERSAELKRVWNGCVPPKYPRTKLPPLERGRDKMWRRDAYIALDEALAAGELGIMPATVVRALLAFSNDSGEVVYPSWATLGNAIGRSARTVGTYLRIALAKGWLLAEHRWIRHPGGHITGHSNLWRVVLPPEAEARMLARKAGARDKRRTDPPPRRNTSKPSGTATSGERAAVAAIRAQIAAEERAAAEEFERTGPLRGDALAAAAAAARNARDQARVERNKPGP
jgi:hypothetical protein